MAGVREHTIVEAGAIFAGRTVAVVGNAPGILELDYGEEIDRHDVVVRMNAGVPRKVQHRALGHKTTVLTAARLVLLEAALRHCTPRWVWGMKLTKSGNREWPVIVNRVASGKWPRMLLFRYPKDQNDRLMEKIGSSPSTGIRVLDLLEQYARPKRVDVYGCNWFGALGGDGRSWWDMAKTVDASHVGENEARAFAAMGFREQKPLHHSREPRVPRKPPS